MDVEAGSPLPSAEHVWTIVSRKLVHWQELFSDILRIGSSQDRRRFLALVLVHVQNRARSWSVLVVLGLVAVGWVEPEKKPPRTRRLRLRYYSGPAHVGDSTEVLSWLVDK